MWIIPSNHPLYSAFAPAYSGSKEDLKELSELSASQLMWRSKPFAWPTWLLRWKRVYWLRHLCGRTLKPSMHGPFVARYTASLAAIPASLSALPVTVKGRKTPDTFGRIYAELSKQLSLFGASSKTCAGTSAWDLSRFTASWQLWAMQLSAEYTQRLRLARHMSGNASLYSQWPTATASSGEYQNVNRDKNGVYRDKALTLKGAVKKFPTPSVAAARQGMNEWDGKRGQTLIGAARGQNWATPTAAMSCIYPEDLEKSPRKSPSLATQATYPTPSAAVHNFRMSGDSQASKSLVSLAALGKLNDGPPPQANPNTTGKSLARLNPAWDAQLMGTTLQKTFYVPMAIV